jgi:predicted AAA+ superfamily ATPase
MLIDRTSHLARLRSLLAETPVMAILGARQVGKTTLARSFPLAPAIRALALERLLDDLEPLR